MANVEMQYGTVSLSTLYFIVKQTGKVFNGTAYETQNPSNWSSAYAVSLSDPQAVGFYQGTIPTGLPVGTVSIYAYLKAGSNPASTDPVIGSQLDAYWNGVTLGGIASLFNPAVVAATSSTITLSTADAAIAADALAASRPAWVSIESGTGALQDRQLTSRVGSTSQFNLSPNWGETPDATSTYALYSPDIGTAGSVITQMTAAATSPASADPSTWTFPQMVAMLKKRFYNKAIKTVSSDGLTGNIVVKDDDGTTTLSTIALTISGSGLVQTQNKSS